MVRFAQATYGGLDMSVMDVLDAEVAWHCQYDPDDKHQYAAKILDAHWPGVPNHGDITSIDWTSVQTVDILTAGFPCQPVSNAGKRKGHEDDRWLWPDVASAIRVLRPRLVFLENVAALVGRGLDRVLAGLAALGFDAEWACVRASEVGGGHTAASGSSSSPGLPTPRARDWKTGGEDGLEERLLPTPRTSDTNGIGKHGSGGPDLRTVIPLLPTPAASNFNDGEDLESWETRRQRNLAKKTNGNGQGTPLSIAVRLLPTPRASDGTQAGPNQRGSSGDLTLPSAAVQLLPTPTTQAHSRNRTANRNDPKDSTNTKSSTLLDVFWTGDPTDPPSNDGSA